MNRKSINPLYITDSLPNTLQTPTTICPAYPLNVKLFMFYGPKV